jgi:hypothetical protein
MNNVLQEPHGVTSQKTPFFIVTAVKTSNLTKWNNFKKDLEQLIVKSNTMQQVK